MNCGKKGVKLNLFLIRNIASKKERNFASLETFVKNRWRNRTELSHLQIHEESYLGHECAQYHYAFSSFISRKDGRTNFSYETNNLT